MGDSVAGEAVMNQPDRHDYFPIRGRVEPNPKQREKRRWRSRFQTSYLQRYRP